MAQGEFSKEEARETSKAAKEMFEGIPKSRRGDYLGHLNDILLFLSAAERNAPTEAERRESGV